MAVTDLPRAGVYCITCTANGIVYVGSSNRLRKRTTSHRCALRKGEHANPRLQNAWNKHGETAFIFSVLEAVDDDELLIQREQFWIDRLNAAKSATGFNNAPFAGSNRGVPKPPGWSERVSKILKGMPKSLEARANIAAAKRGVPRPAEAMKRGGEKRRGRKASDATKAKLSAIRAGRPQPSKRALTFADATEIRRLRLEEQLPQHVLATRFGVSRKSVREILAWTTYTRSYVEQKPAEIVAESVAPIVVEQQIKLGLKATAKIRGRFRRKVFAQGTLPLFEESAA